MQRRRRSDLPTLSLARSGAAVLEGSRVALGAQDCSADEPGAYTGQVSASMLNGLCRFVIVGHSERRRDYCESNELVGRKTAAALGAGIMPIACVGGVDGGSRFGPCGRMGRSPGGCDTRRGAMQDLDKLIIAYEPVWAIGTGRSASPDDAEEIAAAIRSRLSGVSQSAASSVRILYGGSVAPANAASYCAAADVDGLLVGGASLKADSFLEIVASAN